MPDDRIRRVLAAKVTQHSELVRPLTWTTLRRICAREDVDLVVVPIPKPARLLRFDGLWTIGVSSRHPARRHTYFAAHELGHLWLHVDDADGRHVRCYNFDDYTSDDPREEEAETVAAWLLGNDGVRSYLQIPEPATATIAQPSTSLLEALATRRVIRGSELPPLPKDPDRPPFAKRDRAVKVIQEIAEASSIAETMQLRPRIFAEFANDARQRQLLAALDRREEEILEVIVWSTRRL